MLAELTREEVVERLSGEGREALIREGAEAGVAEAQAVWGQMLLDRGEARAAFDWFMRAAAQRHVMALNMVGRCYDLGWGTTPDPGRAAECFRVAAEQGLPEAMYNYATLLALGRGVAEDKAAALGWLRRAAVLGYAKAMTFLGSFAEDGWACERDMAVAAEWYRRGAEGGDFRGCFNHARMLAAAGDRAAALPWLAQAGASGTDAFVTKAIAYCRAEPSLGGPAVAALLEGARC